MDSVLEEAEKLIESSADLKTKTDYRENKNALLCGPFSEIALILQRDNRKIREQIENLKREKEETLKENIIRNVLSMANKISFQKETKIDTVKGSLKVLIHSMQTNECITRSDMRDIEIENKKLKSKIHEIKNAKILVKKEEKERNTKTQERLNSLLSVINDTKAMIAKLEYQNKELQKSNAELEEKVDIKREKLTEVTKIYIEKKGPHEASLDKKEYLTKKINSATKKVNSAMLKQRYAGVDFEKNKEQLKMILKLKNEINKQKEEKERLKKLETDIKLKSIRKTQLKTFKTTYV